MSSSAWRARAGVLLLAGAVALHQLVYGLARVQPDEHAHAYLDWLRPVLFALLVGGVAEVVVRALRVHRRERTPPPRGRVLWPVMSALLLAVFVAQEATEAAFAGDGHAHALRELIVGHGLWIALPLALIVGAVLALALRGAAAADRLCLIVVPARRTPPATAPPSCRAPITVLLPLRGVLGRTLAGRGPPLVV